VAKPERGDRFPLLLYRRLIARYRGPTFLLTVLLLGLWFPVSQGWLAWPRPPADAWLLAGGAASLAVYLIVLVTPSLAYVQPRRDHVRIQTPLYRLKVSYRRIHNTRPIDFGRMFPPSALRRGERKLLAPFFGMTAVGLDLHSLPLKRLALRLFFSRFLFATDQPGLVLLVDDWMALSRQVSTIGERWRASGQPRGRGIGVGASAILQDEE
jgi:extradiol dioxygenase family protein